MKGYPSFWGQSICNPSGSYFKNCNSPIFFFFEEYIFDKIEIYLIWKKCVNASYWAWSVVLAYLRTTFSRNKPKKSNKDKETQPFIPHCWSDKDNIVNLALLFHGGPIKITLTVPFILFFHFLFLFMFVVRVKQCVDLCVDMYTTNLLYESKGNKDYSKLELNVNNKILEVATFV